MISAAILAAFYMNTERHELAEPLLLKIIAPTAKSRESDEYKLTSIAELGVLYRDQDRWEEALVCYARIAEALKEREGPEHIETQKALFDWALCCMDAGEREQGILQLNTLLDLREQTLGTGHEQTLLVSNELAHICIEEEQYERAIELFSRDLPYHEEHENEEDWCCAATTLPNVSKEWSITKMRSRTIKKPSDGTTLLWRHGS